MGLPWRYHNCSILLTIKLKYTYPTMPGEVAGTHIPISLTVNCRNKVLSVAGALVDVICGILSITWRVAFCTYKSTKKKNKNKQTCTQFMSSLTQVHIYQNALKNIQVKNICKGVVNLLMVS